MQSNIRNFVIISHIDHGKSTLADRFLEITGAVAKDKMKEQFLDSMDLEREKGITIKMHPVRLNYQLQTTNSNEPMAPSHTGYTLNLIDTPGHIDFSYEISRALACCEGAILLVDVKQGIQAQTLFNLEKAQKQGLSVIGAVNKVDLADEEQIRQAKKELAEVIGNDESEILAISGKTGQGVESLLEKIIQKIEPPKINSNQTDFKALIFDSKYDSFSGVVVYIRVFSGEIKKGMKINLLAGNYQTEAKEVGYFNPNLVSCSSLASGEIGYIKTGIKVPDKVRVGDTITIANLKSQISDIEPLPGYQHPQPVLFLSLYPSLANNFDLLKDALVKYKLNDPAFEFQPESQMALGRGFRCGFLGSLHAEITVRRLKNEFGLDLIATSPQVVFWATLKNGKRVEISSPALWPDASGVQEIQEPHVKVEIITPNRYFNQLFRMFPSFEINLESTQSLTKEKSLLLSQAPLREIISGNFYDKLKSSSEGYASFNFEKIGYKKADLVKVDVLIAGQKEEAFAKILPEKKAFGEMKGFLQKLKEILPPQQFALSLQAAIGGKIIARETIKAQRKDVTAKLYGGDVTRKNKLLEAQKKGKQKLKEKAKVNIPAGAYLEILKS